MILMILTNEIIDDVLLLFNIDIEGIIDIIK